MSSEWIELEHIGTIIQEELLEAYEVTAYRVCKEVGIPQMTLRNVLHGKRALSSEVALKLGKYFGMDPKYLLNIQTELEIRKKERELVGVLESIQPLKRGQTVRQESWQEIESESLLLGKAVTTRRVPES